MSQDPGNEENNNNEETKDNEENQENEENGGLEVKYTPEQLTEKLVRAADENKKLRQQRNDAKARADKLAAEKRESERANLEEQGKYKEANESLKARIAELESGLKKKDETYATERVISAVKEEAIKMGVTDVQDLSDLVALSPWNELEVDDRYNARREDIKKMLLEQKKVRPRLFGNKKLNTVDSPPGKTTDTSGQNKIDQANYEKELRAANTQKEFDAVRKKYGRV